MTLDEAIAEAKRRPGSDELAVWVRETFVDAWPCGWPEPRVLTDPIGGNTPSVEWEPLGVLDPDELLAIASDLVRVAQEAKASK